MSFTDVTYLREFPNGSNSPAMVNRKTGQLYINLDRWRSIPFEHRVFILLHEKAHCVLDSSDEKEVDALAHKWFIEMGYSLKDSVYALTKVLHANSKINAERSFEQYKRAKKIEDRHNKLSNFDGYDEIKNNPDYFITEIEDNYDDDSIVVHFDEYDFNVNAEVENVKGLGRKEARKKKRAVRLFKRIGRGKKKHAVANDIQAGADTRKIYADKGILVETRAQSISKGIGGTIDKITSALTGGMGKAAGAVESIMPEQSEQPEQQPQISNKRIASVNTETSMPADVPKKSNTTMYIVGGIAAVAVIGILIFAIKK